MEKIKNLLRRSGIVPRFVEVTLFLASLVLLLIFITDSVFRAKIFELLFTKFSLVFSVIFLLVLYGMYLSFRRIFAAREMTTRERLIVFSYIIPANIFIGLSALASEPGHARNVLVIFPVLNIISALLLVLFAASKSEEDAESVSADPTKLSDVIFDVIFVFLIFAASKYIFKNSWMVTFSICMVYAMGINEIVDHKIRQFIG